MGGIDRLVLEHGLGAAGDDGQTQWLLGEPQFQQCLDEPEDRHHAALLIDHEAIAVDRCEARAREQQDDMLDGAGAAQFFRRPVRSVGDRSGQALGPWIVTFQLRVLRLVVADDDDSRFLGRPSFGLGRYGGFPGGRQGQRSDQRIVRQRVRRRLLRIRNDALRRSARGPGRRRRFHALRGCAGFPRGHALQSGDDAPGRIAQIDIKLVAGLTAVATDPRPHLRRTASEDLDIVECEQHQRALLALPLRLAGDADLESDGHLQRAVEQARMQQEVRVLQVLRLHGLDRSRQPELGQDLVFADERALDAAITLPVREPHQVEDIVVVLRRQYSRVAAGADRREIDDWRSRCRPHDDAPLAVRGFASGAEHAEGEFSRRRGFQRDLQIHRRGDGERPQPDDVAQLPDALIGVRQTRSGAHHFEASRARKHRCALNHMIAQEELLARPVRGEPVNAAVDGGSVADGCMHERM